MKELHTWFTVGSLLETCRFFARLLILCMFLKLISFQTLWVELYLVIKASNLAFTWLFGIVTLYSTFQLMFGVIVWYSMCSGLLLIKFY